MLTQSQFLEQRKLDAIINACSSWIEYGEPPKSCPMFDEEIPIVVVHRGFKITKKNEIEPLEKRSKNVRAQTRGLPLDKIRQRLVRYAQTLGFNPQPHPRTDQFGVGNNGRGINYNTDEEPGFGIAHELGHALQTPRGTHLGDEQYNVGRLDDGLGIPTRMTPKDKVRHEAVAVGMEPNIRRRAGVGIELENNFINGSGIGQTERPNWFGKPSTRRQASKVLGAWEDGRRSIGVQGKILGSNHTIDARINQRTKGYVPAIDTVRAMGLPAKAARTTTAVAPVPDPVVKTELLKAAILLEELIKSKNVRNQTRNLPGDKIYQRLHQFAASKNLGMVMQYPDPNKPQVSPNPHAKDNILYYGGAFNPEHELAHALMTPDGNKIQNYYDNMDNADKVYEDKVSERFRKIKEGVDSRTLPRPPRPWSKNHEARAVELEQHISRRAGIRNNKSSNPNYLAEQASSDKHLSNSSPLIRQQIKEDRTRIDEGLSFTDGGVATTLKGIHAKINARAKR